MNNVKSNLNEKLATVDRMLVDVISNDNFAASAEHLGVYTYQNVGPVEERRDEYVSIRDKISHIEAAKLEASRLIKKQLDGHLAKSFYKRLFSLDIIKGLRDELAVTDLIDAQALANLKTELASIPTEIKWEENLHNLITTVGKNNILDNHFTGSSYTATWFTGLIDNASFTALAAADTMASHAGWIEFVGYSNATRIAPSWTTAAAGSKAFSTPVSFNINAGATLNGAFINSVSTKSGTTGVLCSEGSFAATRAVLNGDTLNVSYTSTLT